MSLPRVPREDLAHVRRGQPAVHGVEQDRAHILPGGEAAGFLRVDLVERALRHRGLAAVPPLIVVVEGPGHPPDGIEPPAEPTPQVRLPALVDAGLGVAAELQVGETAEEQHVTRRGLEHRPPAEATELLEVRVHRPDPREDTVSRAESAVAGDAVHGLPDARRGPQPRPGAQLRPDEGQVAPEVGDCRDLPLVREGRLERGVVGARHLVERPSQPLPQFRLVWVGQRRLPASDLVAIPPETSPNGGMLVEVARVLPTLLIAGSAQLGGGILAQAQPVAGRAAERDRPLDLEAEGPRAEPLDRSRGGYAIFGRDDPTGSAACDRSSQRRRPRGGPSRLAPRPRQPVRLMRARGWAVRRRSCLPDQCTRWPSDPGPRVADRHRNGRGGATGRAAARRGVGRRGSIPRVSAGRTSPRSGPGARRSPSGARPHRGRRSWPRDARGGSRRAARAG